MSAKILDGKTIAATLRDEIKKEVLNRQSKNLSIPGLTVILVGSDSASEIYVTNKEKACLEVGFRSIVERLPEQTTQDELIQKIIFYNKDSKTHGILVQLPLPAHLDANLILDHIDPNKDVDGFHPLNVGLLAQRRPNLRPCTPYGIMMLLEHTQEIIRGKHAVIVGASNIVGRPVALELLQADATVTICHKFTKHLETHVRQADILVVAVGIMDVVKSGWIKHGAIVIDVGIHRLENGSIRGDIDFEHAKKVASWITPVPGGVGPMTIACLLKNTLIAIEK